MTATRLETRQRAHGPHLHRTSIRSHHTGPRLGNTANFDSTTRLQKPIMGIIYGMALPTTRSPPPHAPSCIPLSKQSNNVSGGSSRHPRDTQRRSRLLALFEAPRGNPPRDMASGPLRLLVRQHLRRSTREETAHGRVPPKRQPLVPRGAATLQIEVRLHGQSSHVDRRGLPRLLPARSLVPP